MAPEHNMTEVMKSEQNDDAEAGKSTSPSSEMADKTPHQQDEVTTPSKRVDTHSSVQGSNILSEFEGLNSHRTESTATDDSGIAAEFDYQNLDLDENDAESVLDNSMNNDGLKASSSSCNSSHEDDGTSSDSSLKQRLDQSGHLSRTPTRSRQLSSEDESLSPRQRWWSPHRAVCSESLDSIAEERRRRSKGDISKRTAWLKERTEFALEKSALVRKRSAELIQTGKRLRNEEM